MTYYIEVIKRGSVAIEPGETTEDAANRAMDWEADAMLEMDITWQVLNEDGEPVSEEEADGHQS